MSALSKSAKYYREHPVARALKNKYQSKFNAQPSEKKNRAELNKVNREAGTYGNGDKKDASHTKNGIKMKPQSKNRGSKSDQPGDRRARGKKK